LQYGQGTLSSIPCGIFAASSLMTIYGSPLASAYLISRDTFIAYYSILDSSLHLESFFSFFGTDYFKSSFLFGF
jgi:hypothetical protein